MMKVIALAARNLRRDVTVILGQKNSELPPSEDREIRDRGERINQKSFLRLDSVF